MKFSNASEVKAHLWEALHLVDHSITFHVIDVGDDIMYFRPGIIDCSGDLWESDGWFDIGTAHYDESKILVFAVESYMIGEGESDHADWSDIELLEQINEESHDAMDAFLREYAESLCQFGDFELENPAYEEPDEEDDDDESEI